MKHVVKAGLFVFWGLLFIDRSFAQAIMPIEVPSASLQGMNSVINLSEFKRHKSLPSGYEKEALLALSHFPELKNTPIKFKIKNLFTP